MSPKFLEPGDGSFPGECGGRDVEQLGGDGEDLRYMSGLNWPSFIVFAWVTAEVSERFGGEHEDGSIFGLCFATCFLDVLLFSNVLRFLFDTRWSTI